jgi:carboxymethylenebutenolidase
VRYIPDALTAGSIRIAGHGGDEIEAYLAQPQGDGPFGGVVVIHHMPGFDRWSREVCRTFAAAGYLAICPHLHFRESAGGTASPEDAAAAARAAGGVPDERLVGDVEGAMRHLRSLPFCNGRVGVIGYCSGGRQAFLAACSLPLDAAVDCYGAFVARTPPPELGMRVTAVLDRAPGLRCPLLGLFGAEDRAPSPEEVAELDAELTRLGKPHEFHTYPGAGHGFFAVDRPSYRVEAAVDGWARILDFFGRHLEG